MSDNSAKPRRSFLKASLTLSVASLFAPPKIFANEQSENPADEFGFLVGPYLQTNFHNDVNILWITNANGVGWVEYGEQPDDLSIKAFGKSEYGLMPANSRLNNVKLRNLKPGTTYFYRVVSKEIKDFGPYKMVYGNVIKSEIRRFENAEANKQEISFLMFNDIHDRPESIPFLYNLVAKEKRDFIFFNGDIFNYQKDEKQIIDNMLKPCVELFAKETPFVFVRGNHETRGKFARELPEYFMNVGKTSFTLGPVRFVILDTGEDKPDSDAVYAGIVDFDQYRIEQAEWLKEEIKTKEFKKAKFRIVMMHIPPRFSGDWHGAKHCTELFEPLLNTGKVDLVLSGHTHEYKIHQPNQSLNQYPLVIGGGPKTGIRTITEIKANSNEINVIMTGDSGKEVGRYVARRK